MNGARGPGFEKSLGYGCGSSWWKSRNCHWELRGALIAIKAEKKTHPIQLAKLWCRGEECVLPLPASTGEAGGFAEVGPVCDDPTRRHGCNVRVVAKERGRERKSRIDTSGEPSIAGGRIGQGGGQLSRREVKLSCRPNQAVERREPPVLFAIFCTLGAGQAERTSRHFTGLRGAQ